jgi:DeoR family glycerol-3-phosphate regulon repressor
VAGLSNRQTEILNIARAFGRVMVEDLAKRFEVSAQTIRKDLNDLCDQRSLTRDPWRRHHRLRRREPRL